MGSLVSKFVFLPPQKYPEINKDETKYIKTRDGSKIPIIWIDPETSRNEQSFQKKSFKRRKHKSIILKDSFRLQFGALNPTIGNTEVQRKRVGSLEQQQIINQLRQNNFNRDKIDKQNQENNQDDGQSQKKKDSFDDNVKTKYENEIDMDELKQNDNDNKDKDKDKNENSNENENLK
ncbi:hypothetical protein M0811_00686 [Anaeramoeba ignava]|uniref:Uncharacterized protein n=1 Tax=Anaeramoeba ignava TaxID=1746090 RepID=A0A9Q0LJR0_ANAIG|nr:hypothetical protein M0811_00686 [Anaeramoeba ignava]